jgi:hypothetical protein
VSVSIKTHEVRRAGAEDSGGWKMSLDSLGQLKARRHETHELSPQQKEELLGLVSELKAAMAKVSTTPKRMLQAVRARPTGPWLRRLGRTRLGTPCAVPWTTCPPRWKPLKRLIQSSSTPSIRSVRCSPIWAFNRVLPRHQGVSCQQWGQPRVRADRIIGPARRIASCPEGSPRRRLMEERRIGR